MSPATTDLSDAHPGLGVADPVFRDYGGVAAFHGPAHVLKVFEDNAMVREALEQPGEGRVLVVDGGGSMRCALLGGNLAKLAEDQGWAGVIVHGCVRDVDEIAACKVGVKGLAAHPRKSAKGLHGGRAGGRVELPGTAVEEGHWVYADRDGIVVSDRRL